MTQVITWRLFSAMPHYTAKSLQKQYENSFCLKHEAESALDYYSSGNTSGHEEFQTALPQHKPRRIETEVLVQKYYQRILLISNKQKGRTENENIVYIVHCVPWCIAIVSMSKSSSFAAIP